ncbi:hypothetical protein L6452_19341 [Arctium lappa]|uniref:Uncharacterized protein n=1 Tax=Arctium lappa TaxID=4217 RepID=A0ACB9B7K3_ARCLA|nr:hypothetical protein L6452_19341 [Arctium lappa]
MKIQVEGQQVNRNKKKHVSPNLTRRTLPSFPFSSLPKTILEILYIISFFLLSANPKSFLSFFPLIYKP